MKIQPALPKVTPPNTKSLRVDQPPTTTSTRTYWTYIGRVTEQGIRGGTWSGKGAAPHAPHRRVHFGDAELQSLVVSRFRDSTRSDRSISHWIDWFKEKSARIVFTTIANYSITFIGNYISFWQITVHPILKIAPAIFFHAHCGKHREALEYARTERMSLMGLSPQSWPSALRLFFLVYKPH
jgi:hypothetical protein